MKLSLREAEHIRNIYRQSKWVLLEPIALSMGGLILPWYLILQYGSTPLLSQLLQLWSIGLGLYVVRKILIWRGNSYIVTNQRLVKVYQHGLLDRNVVETPIERILNVSYKTTLPFPYGDVEVQVVGLMDPMVLKHVPKPDVIKDYIWQLHNRKASEHGTFQASDIEHVQERVGYAKRNRNT